MAKVWDTTVTADGNTIVNLTNIRGNRNIYTVQLAGGFGSGTVTAFTNPKGSVAAAAGTTYDVPILDAGGVAISAASNESFNFECNSDGTIPTVLKLIMTGATGATLNVRVDNVG